MHKIRLHNQLLCVFRQTDFKQEHDKSLNDNALLSLHNENVLHRFIFDDFVLVIWNIQNCYKGGWLMKF